MPHVGQTNENANNFLVILFVGLKLSKIKLNCQYSSILQRNTK